MPRWQSPHCGVEIFDHPSIGDRLVDPAEQGKSIGTLDGDTIGTIGFLKRDRGDDACLAAGEGDEEDVRGAVILHVHRPAVSGPALLRSAMDKRLRGILQRNNPDARPRESIPIDGNALPVGRVARIEHPTYRVVGDERLLRLRLRIEQVEVSISGPGVQDAIVRRPREAAVTHLGPS